ncbi:hypothetical protein KAM398_24640 [Acinetobacter sp. KAM398]|nr:hypothetical protein KAM392_24700 [Acinetobacter sp. KAM392]GJC34713.1 hypothetical protein KAM393_18820 [Acinetobacter sp. KAM393]GJC38115.1 hypothetical protein KAM394_24550 [Acinetobacter sp. KAM394]GJC40361.1 hypothetical protein KAM395_18820 [Acinetobacter sp. KAM395]GJC43182.1 hypothetical protein KAM396_18790 [Acinetobacter sp. KAM396]GJC46043.1 hypothetical protein KAM397_19230 [Acinetobacter sp. KAM397]GJC49412.1 hypothetical protein KAM398_24640 [Acinetobacter sp. KAM398]GJC5152
MSTYFAQLLAVKLKQNKKSFKMAMLALLLFPSAQLMAETQNKAVWYRYYDQKGVANISSNVTPNHIRYGYEALDRNMQVIQRARPYNTETDIKKAPQRAAQARQSESDQRLKKAYTNSQTATIKRNNTLAHIKKQISFQQEQLKQLQTDRISFKRQEMEYLRKVKPVPLQLKTNLDNNLKNIELKKDMIQSLQTSYRNTQAEYDRIIQRLKALE